MAKTDATIREDISVFDMLARYGGWIVVAGLGVEVVLAFAYRGDKPFFEAWGPVCANALVAFGVVAEIYFHGLSSDAQSELDRRSEEKVAAANERAANAERETEKLRERTAWRRLDIEMARALRDALAEMDPGNVTLVYGTNDWESRNFADELATAFRNAGWNTVFVSAGYAGEPVYGVRVPPIAPNNEREIPTRIAAAFEKAGVPFIPGNAPAAYMTTSSEYGFVRPTEPFGVVYVGPKHMLHPE